MNEILKLKDVLRYTKYDTETGIVILINDVLNLHLRPSSIDQMTVTTSPDRTTVHLSTKLTDEITKDGGKLYTGDVEVTFDKMDVSKVYPGGFSIDRWMGIDSILSTLFRKTRVKIDKSECDIIMTDPLPILRFKETSIFWKGGLDIKLNDLPIIVEMELDDIQNTIDTVIDGGVLNGFTN